MKTENLDCVSGADFTDVVKLELTETEIGPMGAHRKWVADEKAKMASDGVAQQWAICYLLRATAAGGCSYHPLKRLRSEIREAILVYDRRLFVEHGSGKYRELLQEANTFNLVEGTVKVPYTLAPERVGPWGEGKKKSRSGEVIAVLNDAEAEAAAEKVRQERGIRTPDVAVTPVETPETPPVETPAAEATPVETPPTEAIPVEAPPVEAAPVETPAAEADTPKMEEVDTRVFKKTPKGRYVELVGLELTTYDGERFRKEGKGKNRKFVLIG